MLYRLKNFAQRRPLLFNSIIYGSFYTGAEFAQQTYTRVFKLSRLAANNPEESLSNISAASGDMGTRPIFGWVNKFNRAANIPVQCSNYNWAQLERFAIYGCLVAGPILHGWYKWLDVFYKGKSMRVVLAKLFADQFILTPPLIMLFFVRSLYPTQFLAVSFIFFVGCFYTGSLVCMTVWPMTETDFACLCGCVGVGMSLMEGRSDAFGECKAKFVHTFKTSCMYWLPVQFLNFLLIPPILRVFFVSVAAFCWVNILCYLKSVPLTAGNKD